VKIAASTVGGDGGLARGNPRKGESRSEGATGERHDEGRIRAELTRVRSRRSANGLRVCVGVPQRWKAPRVAELVSLHGGAKKAILAVGWKVCARAWSGSSGATGVSEARHRRKRTEESNAARQSEEARRSERGVVKRQVHRSFGRGCKPEGQGRGESLEEKPVAHEARVLVVEKWEAEVGRTHRCSCSVASRKADHRMQRASSKQPLRR